MKNLFVIETEERKLIIQSVSPVLYDLRGRKQLPDEIAIVVEDVPHGDGLTKDIPFTITMQEAKKLMDVLSALTGYSPSILPSKN